MEHDPPLDLESFVAEETALPVPEEPRRWVEHLSRMPGAAAVLFYGSGLRGSSDEPGETVHDFYLLVHRYRDFDSRRWLAWAGTLVPPNVYYREDHSGEVPTRCKVAVLTVARFRSAARGESFTPHVWARFCQPCRIPWTADESLRAELTTDVAEAVRVFHRRTLHLVETCSMADFWRTGLRSTYADEIRSEKASRTDSLVDAAATDYAARTSLALADLAEWGRQDADGRVCSRLSVRRRRAKRFALRLQRPLRKGVVVARWIKAAFTFDGGLDYARWKVERHSGVRIEITDFQRRHPLLGGLSLVFEVVRRGGLR